VDRFARYCWLVLAYNLGVILWGAVVRATGSGAGCGAHWPLCNGEVVPRSPSAATLVEFSHRATSGAALLLVLGLLVAAFRLRPKGDPTRAGAVWSFVFILGEAAVGAALVLFELVADNASLARALFMGCHLVNTFFLLAALALTAHWASGGAPIRARGERLLSGGLAAAAAALLLVGASGAVAALGDTLFPSRSLAEALAQDLSPTAHLLIRLRLLHPTFALVTAVLLLAIAAQLPGRRPGDANVLRYSRALGALVLAQTLAGFLNVSLLAPVWLQIVHLLLADLVWMVLVLLTAATLAAPAPSLAEPAPRRMTLPVAP
jgi:heme A synthase